MSDRVVRLVSPYWLMDWFGTTAIRFWAIVMFMSALLALAAACARGVLTYLHHGWDGGRTLLKVLLAMCNIIYIPKHMWDYVAASTKKTWNLIYDFFDDVRRQHQDDGQAAAEGTPAVKRRLRQYLLDGDNDLGLRVDVNKATGLKNSNNEAR